MRFGTFLLRVDNKQEASLDDLKRVCEIGLKRFQPLGQKNLYMIDTDIIKLCLNHTINSAVFTIQTKQTRWAADVSDYRCCPLQ